MFSWSRRIRLLGLLALVVVAGVVVAVVVAAGGSTGPNYYLALGDSLAVGIQPTASGQQLTTDAGYVNDIYAHYRTRIPTLELKEMGCPGDSTANVLTGQGNTVAATFYHCDRQSGSQLKAAVAFLRAHRSRVKLVSIDIGANDIVGCLDATVFARGLAATVACLRAGEASIAGNLPRILSALKRAAAPGTELVGGDLYDPFLAGLLSSSAMLRTVATQSVRLVTQVNAEIAYADAAAGFQTADVADAFSTYDTAKVRAAAFGGSADRNLVVICSYTWVCAKAPRGPNIHPNAAGYRVIARAYEQVLPKSL